MTLVFSIAAVLKTLEQLLEKTNCVALDLSLRKKFSKIYLIVIHGCRDERKYTHFSVLYGIAYVVIAKPQFLSDSEALIAFHSSACVLLYRAPLNMLRICYAAMYSNL